MATKYKDWDSYLLICPSDGLRIQAQMIGVPGTRIFSVTLTDTTLGQECHTEQKRLKFRLDNHWKDNSFLVFSNDEMMLAFVCKEGIRNVIINAPKLILPDGRKGLTANIRFQDGRLVEDSETVIRLEDMKASGDLRLGRKTIKINTKDSFGLLEWGRTVSKEKA
jgi:hypothetical protein